MTSPPLAAGAAAGGAGTSAASTVIVSNLMTSTGHSSAASMIVSVIGLVNSAFMASGRMMQVSSVTWKTSGQVVSHASQTMQPGAIQTFVTSSLVAMLKPLTKRGTHYFYNSAACLLSSAIKLAHRELNHKCPTGRPT